MREEYLAEGYLNRELKSRLLDEERYCMERCILENYIKRKNNGELGVVKY